MDTYRMDLSSGFKKLKNVGLQYIYDKVAYMEKRQEEWVTEEA